MRPSHYGAGNQKKKLFFEFSRFLAANGWQTEPGDSGYGLCLKVHTSDDE